MIHARRVECSDEQSMRELGSSLITQLASGTLLCLSGELGAGKSFLARAMIHAAGYEGRVKSPTYTLIESYDIASPRTGLRRIAHMDLYRLADPDELHYLGFDDVLDSHDLVMIEWPEKAGDLMPSATVRISIEYASSGGRVVLIESDCAIGNELPCYE